MPFDPKYSPPEIYFHNRSVLLNDHNYVYRQREQLDKASPDYINVLREAFGPNEAGELSDTFYFTPDEGKSPSLAGYHEHTRGFEWFLVLGDQAKCLVKSHGKQSFAYPGDIIFLPPYTPHAFEWYGNPLRWREMFSAMQMNPGGGVAHRIAEFHPTALQDDPVFDALYRRDRGSVRLTYPTDFEQVDHMPEIIRADQAAATYTFGDITLLLKITRSQWWGQREIWQMHLPAGFTLSCTHYNNKELLLMVQQGRVRVQIDGVEPFVAQDLDYLNIPQHLAATLTVLEGGATLMDCDCTGYLSRAVEELYMRAPKEPGLLDDAAQVQAVLQKHDVYLLGRRG